MTPASATPTRSVARRHAHASLASASGLTYNRFHVTAVCSPTRAALLTGRNQHRVGFGSIAEYPGPFPGVHAPPSRSRVPASPDPPGERLRHRRIRQVAPHARQRAGRRRSVRPLARGLGFDHWWGFLSGAAGQYDPVITQDDSVIGVPQGNDDGSQYYFPDDLTDQPSSGCTRRGPRTPYKPWMMYYSTGCTHSPHHVSKDWADKYKGQFDQGWDVLARHIRPPEGARRRPARHRAHRATRLLPGLGHADRQPRRSFTPARWKSSPALRERRLEHRATHRRDRARWAISTTP